MKEWSEILLRKEDTLETTIKVLHSGGVRIALVVDDNLKLLGTVTDGDIRRALIKHIGMNSFVEEFMNNAPVTALISEGLDVILSRVKKLSLLHMPIIDEQHRLVGLETLEHLIEDKKLDNPVFIMAGGFGTRLQPLTNDKPKPLLNIGNQPILETIINQFIDYGFHNFYISTHYKAEMIREYFGDGSSKGVTIEYIYEESPLGTAGALGLLPDDISQLPLIMMNGDLLTRLDFSQLVQYHSEQGGAATMCIREYDFKVPYGVVKTEESCVISIIEKPVHNFFVNAGIYVLNHLLVKHIKGGKYLDMPNMLEDQINKGEQVNTFPIHEYWLDIGHMDEYERANQEIFTAFKE
jgi:dTDP-glucose pyrophosphorylase